ncbi:MAG: phosphoenolpyruvate carboxykinase (ATP) [Armatimonadetes bacterium]|nr:phosphoenolpyruvate carboxykinase (ATP) [Armatimonadota bacterium]
MDGDRVYELLRPRARWNLPSETLVREAVIHGEGMLSRDGALCVMTGEYTGRSPCDKFVVRQPPSEAHIDWSSPFNQPFAPEQAEALAKRMLDYAQRLPRLYGFLGSVGRGAAAVPVAVLNEFAWHNLMARHMFVRPAPGEVPAPPEFTLLYLPGFEAVPERDGTHSEVAVLCDLERRLGLIAGSQYGGEEKKFFFYLMNYLLPLQGIFPMHCSANVGAGGDVSTIFGLSGTGKTTLSTDPDRRLLGDDEHGWGPEGVFNFEGGCYAKLIHLSQEGEPLIWEAVNRAGAIMENVPLLEGNVPDFDDERVENTRGVYPLDFLANVELSGMAGHPSAVVYLAFDAAGILPPVAVLDEQQALYWFLAGYTARVAGTERGMGSKPEMTFSPCFGAPFLPWHPRKYLEQLERYLHRHRPLVVLMNTGAIGGPFGNGGSRPPIAASRRMLHAAQNGVLRHIPCDRHPELGILVPRECPGVSPELLCPRTLWRGGDVAYRQAAHQLVTAFQTQVNDVYAGSVPRKVLDASPRLG